MNNNIRRKKIISTLLGIGEYLISFVALYFIFRLISKNWLQIQEEVSFLRAGAIYVAFICFLLAQFIQGVGWFYLHKKIGQKVGFLNLLNAYYLANLIRYVPGNIWGYLARLRRQKKIGVSEPVTLYLSLIEIILMIVSAWVIFLISIFFWTQPLVIGNEYIILPAISILFLIFAIFSPAIVKWYIKKYMRGRQINFAFIRLPWRSLTKIFFIYFLYWCVQGLALYFSVISLYPAGIELIIPAAGINAVTWMIGFISFITPSGIGIRETTMIFFLATYIPVGIAGTIAIVSRLIMVICEFIMILLIKILSHAKKA